MAVTAVVVGGLALAGSSFLGGSSAAKKKKALQRIANAPRTDITQVEREGIQSNIENLELAAQLSAGIDEANQDSLLNLVNRGAPELNRTRTSALNQLNSLIEGELPQSVVDQVINQSAARGVASGTSGSQFNRNLTARDFGLTSLNLTQQGLAALPGVTGAISQFTFPAAQANAGGFFISPSDRLQVQTQERALALQLAAQAAGMPTRTDSAAQGLSSFGGLLSGALGGGGGLLPSGG